jgi:hypothetical protein
MKLFVFSPLRIVNITLFGSIFSRKKRLYISTRIIKKGFFKHGRYQQRREVWQKLWC